MAQDRQRPGRQHGGREAVDDAPTQVGAGEADAKPAEADSELVDPELVAHDASSQEDQAFGRLTAQDQELVDRLEAEGRDPGDADLTSRDDRPKPGNKA